MERKSLGDCRLCGDPVLALGPAVAQVASVPADPDAPVEFEWVEHPGCRDEEWGRTLDFIEEALS